VSFRLGFSRTVNQGQSGQFPRAFSRNLPSYFLYGWDALFPKTLLLTLWFQLEPLKKTQTLSNLPQNSARMHCHVHLYTSPSLVDVRLPTQLRTKLLNNSAAHYFTTQVPTQLPTNIHPKLLSKLLSKHIRTSYT
jgi:hypothetical protein